MTSYSLLKYSRNIHFVLSCAGHPQLEKGIAREADSGWLGIVGSYSRSPVRLRGSAV